MLFTVLKNSRSLIFIPDGLFFLFNISADITNLPEIAQKHYKIPHSQTTIKIYRTMDKSDLQTIIRFARQNSIMHKSFFWVLKWYNISCSTAYNQYNINTAHI